MNKAASIEKAGDFVPVYRPAPDRYRGLDTRNFRNGEFYEKWTVNDFSILRDESGFHMIGITHPTPGDFRDEYHYNPESVHEAEHMLFHACASGRTFADLMKPDAFQDCEKILYPSDRPEERPECHAPHLRKAGDVYQVIYGPQEIRLAETKDFRIWKFRTLFEAGESARDPFVFEEEGQYTVLYAKENRVEYRVSRDLITFSKPKVLQVNPFGGRGGNGASSESPFLFKRSGCYYLMWTIWDGRQGCYDHRAFVFGADTLEGLADAAPLCMLPGHAAELYSDESGDYLLSAFHPVNGISAAKVRFTEP